MTHTSTEQAKARDLAYWIAHTTDNPTAALIQSLHARVQELEAQVQRAAEVERAAILERVKNRAVAGALLVEDFRFIVADRGPAAPGQRAPLTDAQIKEGRNAVNNDPDDRPEPWAFREGVKFAERMYGITQEKQG